MAEIRSAYANILNENRILYMPSCLVVEMMTKLYSQVSMINLSVNVHHVVPDLVVMLERLSFNLKTTARAYEESRIKFFMGDWKEDKLRARKLFFNLMSRLGYMSELLGEVDRKLLYNAIEEMSREWMALDEIMEDKCRQKTECALSCDTCRYFRSESNTWQNVMAKIIMSIDQKADYSEPGTYLILVCYNRIRKGFLNAIEEIEKKTGASTRFSQDRILAVSNEDIPISCPKCALMTDSLRRGDSTLIHREYAPAAPSQGTTRRIRQRPSHDMAVSSLRRRHVMPPSLAAISGRR